MLPIESNSLSPDEQIRELAALFAKGLLRWHMSRHEEPPDEESAPEPTNAKKPQKVLEFPSESRLSVHSG